MSKYILNEGYNSKDALLFDVGYKDYIFSKKKNLRVLSLVKYKPKKKYRRKQGHRQSYTKLTITKING